MLHPIEYLRRLALVLFLMGIAMLFAARVSHARSIAGDGLVDVTNNQIGDVKVYALRAGFEPVRIGFVAGFTHATIRVPGAFLDTPGDLYFVTQGMATARADTSNVVAARPSGLYRLVLINAPAGASAFPQAE